MQIPGEKKNSRCVDLFKLWDGLWLLTGHEIINDKANDEGKEEEVQVAEERLFIPNGLGVGLWLHFCNKSSVLDAKTSSGEADIRWQRITCFEAFVHSFMDNATTMKVF